MNEKKTLTISVTTLFLVIAIVVIIFMGNFIYNISMEKQNALEEVSNLNSQVSNLENTVSSLQNTINSVSDTVSNTATSSNTTTNSTSQTSTNDTQAIEAECKTVLQKYLDCWEVGEPKDVLVYLDLLTWQEIVNENTLITIGKIDYIKTSVKYSDFKNTALKYMTESVFEERFSDYKNSNGFVAAVAGSKGAGSFAINDMKLTLNENNVIQYEVNYTYEIVETEENRQLLAVFEKAKNGHYVVSNVDFNH